MSESEVKHPVPGRRRFLSRVSVVEPPAAVAADRTTDISKKGHALSSEFNSNLFSVNVSWITYMMKDGQVRCINQNGKFMMKVANSSLSPLADLVILACAGPKRATTPTIIISLDRSSRVTIFELDANISAEENVIRTELRFPSEGCALAPRRLLGHSSNSTLFGVLHENAITVWDRKRLSSVGQSGQATRGKFSYAVYDVDDALIRAASSTLEAEPAGSTIIDACFTVSECCAVALTEQDILVWRQDDVGDGASFSLVQRVAAHSLLGVAGGQFSAVRVLSGSGPFQMRPQQLSEGKEVLVLAAPERCELLALELNPVEADPVGDVVQSIRFEGETAGCMQRMVVDATYPDSLTIALKERRGLLIMPLALNWCGAASGLPFPYVQNIYTTEPIDQISTITAKSASSGSNVSFVYRAWNSDQGNDKGLASAASVDEINLDREAAQPVLESVGRTVDGGAADAPLVAPIVVESSAATADELAAEGSAADEAQAAGPEGATGTVEGAAVAAESSATVLPEERPSVQTGMRAGLIALPPTASPPPLRTVAASPGRVGHQSANDVGAGASEEEAGAQPVDWGFMKHIAASFVKGLDKKRGEMSERIASEVTKAARAAARAETTSIDPSLTSSSPQEIEQVLAIIREATQTQAASEKAAFAAAQHAADKWVETAAASLSSTLQKEFTRISDGVAATLAQQLLQSRKFNDALAKGVQKMAGGVAKQTLESIGSKQLQESVGTGLGDAFRDSLAPVFRQELRSHFEKDLAPLIGQRVGEMMTSFREKMGECLGAIAEQQHEAARRLGGEVAPAVAEELQLVEKTLSARGGGPSGGFSDSQIDELLQLVQEDVVQPLQSRVQELSAQVAQLNAESRQLEQRLNAAIAGDRVPPTPNLSGVAGPPGLAPQSSPAEREEQQAVVLERQLQEGRAEEAFAQALELQSKTQHIDMLGRLCACVQQPIHEWLDSEPLTARTQMLLMVALARQLPDLTANALASRIEWIEELWLAFDSSNTTDGNARSVQQLLDGLDAAAPAEGQAPSLRRLRAQVRSQMRFLQAQA